MYIQLAGIAIAISITDAIASYIFSLYMLHVDISYYIAYCNYILLHACNLSQYTLYIAISCKPLACNLYL